MSLSGVAKHTLKIVEDGSYTAPSGKQVDLKAEIAYAIQNTRLFTPQGFDALWWEGGSQSLKIEVTSETTAAAARRLYTEGHRDVAALNFASARNPGGGFLGGAKAQEEDLARCSALYPCQLEARGYYDANRFENSLLYTDHLIWSPNVPFFKDDGYDLIEDPFLVSMVTSPAPNAGQAKAPAAQLRSTLLRRAGQVLSVMASAQCRHIVLGAWGCGVFRNDPEMVAQAFQHHLQDPRFQGAFERVIFAIYVRPGREQTDANLIAFKNIFAYT